MQYELYGDDKPNYLGFQKSPIKLVMCGQLNKRGKPDGFCRFIYEDGTFIEGMFNEQYERVGFVRSINYSGYQQIGYCKDGVFNGNGMTINLKGVTLDQGWIEKSQLKGPFKENIAEYMPDILAYFNKI